QAQEHVGAFNHFGQRALVGFLGKTRLVGVHQHGAALVHHALDVGDPDVLHRHAEVDDQVQAGQRRGARTRGHDLDLVERLAHYFQAVDEGSRHTDGGAVLIVVEHRDLHALAQLAFDDETLGRLDVFEVDAAKRGFEAGDDFDQLVGIGFVDLDIEHVQAGELLEQHGLAFHDRLGGQRADVAQAQHGGAVGDYAHQVAARGVAHRVAGILDDLFARRGHAWRVGQRQV